MEISLLTGVHLILTIFDKEEGKIIQYLSDSVEKFRVINHMEDIAVRKRYVKENPNANNGEPGDGYAEGDAEGEGEASAMGFQAQRKPPTQYIT